MMTARVVAIIGILKPTVNLYATPPSHEIPNCAIEATKVKEIKAPTLIDQ